MSKKLGRNDPCHCGSGKKYKRCCIDQDKKKKKLQEQSLPFPFGWNAVDKRGEISLDSREVRKDKDFSERKKRFEELIASEPDEDTLFFHFLSLTSSARREDEHLYILEKIRWIKRSLPDVFRSLSTYLIKYAIVSAVVCDRIDAATELIAFLNPAVHIGEFNDTVEILFYFGDLNSLDALKDLFIKELDSVLESKKIFQWAKDKYLYDLRDLFTICEYLKAPLISAESLYKELQAVLPFKISLNMVDVDLISPLKKGREGAIGLLRRISRDDENLLLPLRFAMAIDWSNRYSLSFGRALLAAENLVDYIYSREGRVERFHEMLVLDEESLKTYSRNHLGVLFSKKWIISSLMSILPYYIDLLEESSLIHREQANYSKSFVMSMLPSLLSDLSELSWRASFIYTILAADIEKLYNEEYLLKSDE